MSVLTGWLRDNPALAREETMRQGQRRRRGVWPEIGAWVGVVAALALAAGSAWWLTRPERNPWQSRTFVAGLCAAYFLLVALLVPGPAASSISGERERETWQELLLTRLRPWQVVWAKLLSQLRVPAFLLAGVLPALLMGAHAGRIPPDHLLWMLAVMVVAPVGITALSVWISGRIRSSRVAMTLAYLCTGLLFGASLAWSPQLLVRGENLWWYLSPVWHTALLSLGAPGLSPLARPLLPEWLWCVLFYGGLAALTLALTARRVAKEELP